VGRVALPAIFNAYRYGMKGSKRPCEKSDSDRALETRLRNTHRLQHTFYFLTPPSLIPRMSTRRFASLAVGLLSRQEDGETPKTPHHGSPVVAFIIGLSIILLASILNAAGLNLTKLDHVHLQTCVCFDVVCSDGLWLGTNRRRTQSAATEGLVAPVMAAGHDTLHVRQCAMVIRIFNPIPKQPSSALTQTVAINWEYVGARLPASR
jgi:hypothetical protein